MYEVVPTQEKSIKRSFTLQNSDIEMKRTYTLCNSEEEANALGHFIISKGYEGVQNDSYRYCDLEIRFALKENRRHHRNFCFIGVNGCQMVVGKNKKEMRKNFSYKYIEKERIFRKLLERNEIKL